MSDSESPYDDDLYDSFSLITPSLDPLVGDDMTGRNMEELERNSPILILSPREPHKVNNYNNKNNSKHQEVQKLVYTTPWGGTID